MNPAINQTPAETRGLTALLRCVAVLTEINPQMPVGQALALIQVALDPGKGPREYAQALKIPESTVSRHLIALAIAERGPIDVALLDVRVNPLNMRLKQYWLNPRGAAIVNKCLAALGRIG